MIIIYTDSLSICFGRRECHKIAVIEIFVGEGNQLLISAAVMPTQPKLLHRSRAEIQNGFKIRDISGFFIIILRLSGSIEEIAGRHLFGITHNNQLFGTIDCTNCILRKNLRRFIEYNHIKMNSFRCEEGADTQRGHQEARFNSLDEFACFSK